MAQDDIMYGALSSGESYPGITTDTIQALIFLYGS